MAALSLSELKLFFNIQGTCLMAAMALLLFTEQPNFDRYTPILTGSLPSVFISLLVATALSLLFINFLSNRTVIKVAIGVYALITSSLLIFVMAT